MARRQSRVGPAEGSLSIYHRAILSQRRLAKLVSLSFAAQQQPNGIWPTGGIVARRGISGSWRLRRRGRAIIAGAKRREAGKLFAANLSRARGLGSPYRAPRRPRGGI